MPRDHEPSAAAVRTNYGVSNSRYGRHRARSQLGPQPDPSTVSSSSSSSYTGPVGSYMPTGSSASSPPPPPPYSSTYEPVTASIKPTIVRSTSSGSTVSSRSHRSPTVMSSKSTARRQPSGSSTSSNYVSSSSSHRREANSSVLSDGDRREANGIWIMDSPPTTIPVTAPSSSSSSNMRFDTPPPMIERSRSGSHTSRHRHEGSSSSYAAVQAGDDTPRRRARKVIKDEDDDGLNDTDEGKTPPKGSSSADASGATNPRPVRIKYESATRGIGGGKREISHASLGKLIARLTDAHQYDAEFRDVFLLTYRCFSSPYDFIKKLLKRYTAVLTMCGGIDPDTLSETQRILDQITKDEENDRSSTSTSISTAKSDINTGMEANVSIMRLLSVIKFWIKESGFIEMDLLHDRRAQRKLLALLQEIQSTNPIASIRQHAESLLLSVTQVLRQQNAPSSSPVSSNGDIGAHFTIPGPPLLTPSTSQSSVSSDHSGDSNASRYTGTPDLTQSKLSSAMSKLKLTRSSSDSRKDRSMVKLKPKHTSSSDVLHVGSYNEDPSNSFRRGSPMVSAPKMMRGVTTGSTESMISSTNPLEDVIQDTIQRARLTASRSSSRTSYDNVQPLSGVTAQELADQLTLIEAEGYFARINPRELTNKAWTRETKHKEAPHVMALIELFDATAEWVSSEILHPQLQAAERARLITLFVDAADGCCQLNNFNSLFEITTGLSAPCIRQLNTTWGLVPQATQEKYQVLMQVCSPDENYRNYRQAFALAEGQPRLPCSFILVKDLFTIEEAMKSIEDGLVNWQKYRKVYKAISEALDRQNMNYLPVDGSNAAGISRKGKGALRHDRKVQIHIRNRLDTIRKDSTVLYQLARNANTQESIMFVNSLSEAGFL